MDILGTKIQNQHIFGAKIQIGQKIFHQKLFFCTEKLILLQCVKQTVGDLQVSITI